MIGRFYHIQIVFDDNDRIPPLGDELVENGDQLFHIMEVQTGGGFIEEIDGIPRPPPGEFAGEFDALRFPAGKRGGTLPPV